MKTKANMPSIIAAGVILGANLAGVTAAAAQSDDGPLRVAVRYVDLDLRSHEGARQMAARIDAAASRACGGQPDGLLLDRRALYDHCKRDAVSRAVNQLDAPAVTAMAGRAVALTIAGR